MNKSLTVTIKNIPDEILDHLWERAKFRFDEAGVGGNAERTENIVIDAGVILYEYQHHWPMLMADIFLAYAMTTDFKHKHAVYGVNESDKAKAKNNETTDI